MIYILGMFATETMFRYDEEKRSYIDRCKRIRTIRPGFLSLPEGILWVINILGVLCILSSRKTGILFLKDLLIIFLFPGILYRDIQSEMREKVYGSGQRDKA